ILARDSCRFSNLPLDRSSATVTTAPWPTSSSTKWLPMNDAPGDQDLLVPVERHLDLRQVLMRTRARWSARYFPIVRMLTLGRLAIDATPKTTINAKINP